jgi:hypothetical protein
MSNSFNQTLLPTGLKAAEEYLWNERADGAMARYPLVWNSGGSQQAGLWQENLLFFSAFLQNDLDRFLGHKTYADVDPKLVNDWFESQPSRFPRLIPEKPVDPFIFYIGMVYALRNLSWIGGEASEYGPGYNRLALTADNLPAYKLTANKNRVRFFDIGEAYPAAIIPTFDTVNGQASRISVIVWFSGESEEWELISRARNIAKMSVSTGTVDAFSGVVLPNILAESTLKLGEDKMKGLWTIDYRGRKVRVENAGMFLRNVLSAEGPLSEGAAFMEMTKEAAFMEAEDPRPLLHFDMPFNFAFVDTGLARPTVYTATWVGKEDFSKERIDLSSLGVE